MTFHAHRPAQAITGPALQTRRIALRAPAGTDAPRLAALLDDFEVSGNLARVPHPYGLADAEAFIASAEEADRTIFALETGEDGLIGMIGFTHRSGEASLGYWLGRAYWGQGIMTEALIAALGWYFGLTRADHVVSGMFHFNMASLALQQKLGFVETGRSVMHCLARNQEVEHIDTELTRDSFEASLETLNASFERRRSL